MTALVGHEGPWRGWREALSSERLHHAWLLAGKRGLGKAHFARAAAIELLDPAGVGPFTADTHPDLLVLQPLPAREEEAKKAAEGKPLLLKRSISIDQVRQIERRLHTRPTIGRHRAIIIDSIDDLEKAAANALLKSLEEPPQGTIFLLVSHRPGRLLPTIRSRCRVLRFQALKAAEVDALLRAIEPDSSSDDRTAALAVAGGSPGLALDFLARKLGSVHALMARIAEQGDADFTIRGDLRKAVGARPDRERQLAVIEVAIAIATEIALGANRDRAAKAIESHAALVALAARAPAANMDPGLLVLETAGLLAAIARPRGAVT